MLLSVMIADLGPVATLRRPLPNPAEVPGMRSSLTAMCAPFAAAALPQPQLGRTCVMSWFTNADAIDAFRADHALGRSLATGWELRLELMRGVGIWPGLFDQAGTPVDMVDLAGSKGKDFNGPSVAITLGRAYLRTARRFFSVNRGLERQFLDTPSGLWGTAMTDLVSRTVATVTAWTSGDAAMAYVRDGAHGAAVAEHFDPAKDPTGHTFVTGGGFFGFRPLSASGSLSGRNPTPAGLFA